MDAICTKYPGIAACVREDYTNKQRFFTEGENPLPLAWGYVVVLGFGAVFSVVTTILVYLEKSFGDSNKMTSEHFNTAGRMVQTGLTASVIVSQWTWAATLLQSSNVAWQYGVSGPFWYASGATIQILLFGVLAISLKAKCPNAHTVCEIVNARWGKAAHITFLFFSFCATIIVTSMLLLGGAATVEALTGMDYRLASFLIPWGVIVYTAAGGLKATFLASYIHTVIIFLVLVVMIMIVYIKGYSSDIIYDMLKDNTSMSPEDCDTIFPPADGVTFACGPVKDNANGERLTMLSGQGLMFGIINIVGNFGTVFVDQSYWQSAIAAKPTAAAHGYFLGGVCWFSIPFSLATSLGLASTALMLPITGDEAGSGLVPPAVATYLLGDIGSGLILIMLFMAIVSTGSAESIAISSLISYDIYRQYINPEATGDQILKVSRYVIVGFGLFMGAFSIALFEMGLNLGWVYLFMGIVIGSAVMPLWFMMTWSKASGTGAILAAWGGFILAVVTWIVMASIRSGEVTISSLGENPVMLTGNLVAILGSGLIHIVYSLVFDKSEFDFSTLNDKIKLVENDFSGLTETEQDKEVLEKTQKWIVRRGWALTIILVIIWPVLTVPARTFSKDYFAVWVFISICWGFGAALVIAVLPVYESRAGIGKILIGIKNAMFGESEPAEEKQVEEPAAESEA